MSNTPQELNRQGVAFRRSGQNEQARDCYRRALDLQPDFAEAHYNLGLLWQDMGHLADAAASFKRVLELRPDVAMAHVGLGNVLEQSGSTRAAIASYRNALDRMPMHATAHFRLANLLHQTGDYTEAEIHYRTALEFHPGDPKMLTNFGNTLKKRRKFAEALTCYEQALKGDSTLWQAHVNLANLHMDAGESAAALEAYRRAAELRPEAVESHLFLGNALAAMQLRAAAIAEYQKAVTIQPDSAEAHVNLGRLYKAQGDLDKARAACRQASLAEPQNAMHRLSEACLFPSVYRSKTETESLRRRLTEAVAAANECTWKVPLADVPHTFTRCPYRLQFLEGNLRPLKEAYAGVFLPYFRERNRELQLMPREVRPTARPRIGFVVTTGHEAAFLRSLAGVVRQINRDAFEVRIVCPKESTFKIRKGLDDDCFPCVEFPNRFDWAAESIRDAAFDLLYYWEIGTDSTNYFLPFLRLAPVQCTSWGIQVTSGIPEVDYYLSSDLVEPADGDSHYCEKLVRSNTLLTYQAPRQPNALRGRDTFGFSNDQHLYGCIQNLGKLHPDFDETLGRILRQDPDGWLILAQDQSGRMARTLQERFSADLADVASRIMFLPPMAEQEYLSLVSACDVLLEPLHFGGVNTTYDALSLEKPLVAVRSPFHRGRYAAACYQKMGFDACLANDLDEYAKLAIQLGCDAGLRHHVTQQLREKKHALFCDPSAVTEHERIFSDVLADVRE